VRRLRRLAQNRSARWRDRVFVAEGLELVRTALEAPVRMESLYLGAGAGADPVVLELAAAARATGARVFELAPGVLERVADTVTPQPVLAVLPMLDVALAAVSPADLIVVCVGLRDPGNAGTVIRSADAAGAGAVVWCGDSVDPYNPKTVRSSAGSLFHVPLVATPGTEVLETLGSLGYRRLAAAPREGMDYATVDWRRPTAIVLGNEASGLDPALAATLDGSVVIPMGGRAESLNVGVAGAVLCFESLRQRRHGGPTMPRMPGSSGD
jgi:RNA methyltransferase, TrmH family